MRRAQDDQDMNGERQKALEVIYQQTAVQHDKIDDFRAKLLAALPTVTGLGLFALGAKKPDTLNPELLAAIGIFGALASIGLFVHELRGITECYMLIAIGSELERKLSNAEAWYGPFSSRRSWGYNRFISRENAALVVYPSTIAVWVFVAVWPTTGLWHSFVTAVVVLILAALIGKGCLAWYASRVTDYVRQAGRLQTQETVC